jgi:hypothetical protein
MFLHTKAKTKLPEHDPTFGLINDRPLCAMYLHVDIQHNEFSCSWVNRDLGMTTQYIRSFVGLHEHNTPVQFAQLYLEQVLPVVREEVHLFLQQARVMGETRFGWGLSTPCPFLAHVLRHCNKDQPSPEHILVMAESDG